MNLRFVKGKVSRCVGGVVTPPYTIIVIPSRCAHRLGISRNIAAISVKEIATPVCGLVRNDGGYLLLLTEGLAVGALVLSGIHLMGAHHNTLQRTEVGILAVMGALLNSTLDALVCSAIHSH